KIDGAVMALVDIEVLKVSAQQISASHILAEAIIDSLQQPVLVLDKDLTVSFANQSFYQTFRIDAEEVINRRVYDLADGQSDIPPLRTLLEDILPSNTSFKDFEVEHEFPKIGAMKMLLDARRLAFKGNDRHAILLSMQEVVAKNS